MEAGMEKLCVFCKNWEFSGGEPGYSELTPGSDTTMDCKKNHYGKRFRLFDLYGPDDFRAIILKAEKCQDYEPPNAK
jgi:hypothetical protein